MDQDGNEIPWHLEWNSETMKTAFYVVPDQFLAPHTTYSFTARAQARGSLVLNGLDEDTITTSFTLELNPAMESACGEKPPVESVEKLCASAS